MKIEIERKFLVLRDTYKNLKGCMYKQGYLLKDIDKTIRVRIAENKGFLTIKTKTGSFSRGEFEYEIPLNDAEFMLNNLCEKSIIEKIRYISEFEGHIWEIDEFLGENEGLVVAEIELQSEDEEFLKPGFIGKEVTGDKKYYNSNLIKNPYKNWE